MSNVQAAVARREEAANAPARPTPAQIVRHAIEVQKDSFAAVLPADLDPDRWAGLVLTAIKSAPDLMRAFETPQGKTSVLLAAMQCASVSLEPNTPLQEAWILPRKNKGTWEGQLQLGYRGLLKLARRSSEVKEISADVVRKGDEFHYERNLDGDVLRHVPSEDADESEESLRFAYAIVRYTNGGTDFVVMSRSQVHARRALSDSYRADVRNGNSYSPWSKWPADMWRKTALKALAKQMPLTAEVARVTEQDERTLRLEDGTIEATAWAEPERPAIEAPEDSRDEPEPEAHTTPVDEDPPDAGAQGADRGQLQRLSAFLRGQGIDGDGRQAWASERLGRDVRAWSGTDLTFEEAAALLDEFKPEGE